jgi:hypothetical protein
MMNCRNLWRSHEKESHVSWGWWAPPRPPQELLIREQVKKQPFGFRTHFDLTPAGPERRARDEQTISEMKQVVDECGKGCE